MEYNKTVYCWGSQCNLTLVASVLVGVVAFLGSQVVLSPVVSGCLPLCVGVGVGWCGSLPGLSSRFVSGCLRLSPPVCVGVGVGWCGSLPGLSNRFVSGSLVVSLCVWEWVLVGVVAFLGFQVVLCPVVSGCLPLCKRVPLCGGGCWLVW